MLVSVAVATSSLLAFPSLDSLCRLKCLDHSTFQFKHPPLSYAISFSPKPFQQSILKGCTFCIWSGVDSPLMGGGHSVPLPPALDAIPSPTPRCETGRGSGLINSGRRNETVISALSPDPPPNHRPTRNTRHPHRP